jgi:hypothetical protein
VFVSPITLTENTTMFDNQEPTELVGLRTVIGKEP